MTQEALSIREFQKDDLPVLTELTNQLGYETSLEQMSARMEQIQSLTNYWTFVAILDQQVAGYIGLNKNYFWEQDGSFIRIQALVISKEFRRSGIGQKLIESAEKLGKEVGAKLIILNCGNKQERESAHKFYPQMGFEAKSTGYIKNI